MSHFVPRLVVVWKYSSYRLTNDVFQGGWLQLEFHDRDKNTDIGAFKSMVSVVPLRSIVYLKMH